MFSKLWLSVMWVQKTRTRFLLTVLLQLRTFIRTTPGNLVKNSFLVLVLKSSKIVVLPSWPLLLKTKCLNSHSMLVRIYLVKLTMGSMWRLEMLPDLRRTKLPLNKMDRAINRIRKMPQRYSNRPTCNKWCKTYKTHNCSSSSTSILICSLNKWAWVWVWVLAPEWATEWEWDCI